MSSAPQQIMVAFEGAGAGEDELSWGQKENWATITIERTWLPQGGVRPLPDDATVSSMTEAVAYLMGRYQSLRTLIRVADDGRPRQVLFGSGEIALRIVDAGDDEDPAEVADAVCARLRETELDFATEWPVRLAAIRHRGRLTHSAELISHLAIDAAGAAAMMTEVLTRPDTPVTGLQSLAQANWQRSPAGRRHNDAAMHYWGGILRTIDPNRFDNRQPAHSPRYWHGEFTSPALRSAVRAVAEGTGHGTATIFLALFAVALHDVTDVNPVVVRPIVSNRFRPGLAGVVCTAAQAGLCVLDVAGVPFTEALRRVQRATINAYKFAYFDHEDMVALRAGIERDRGTAIDTGCFLNDRHGVGGRGKDGPTPTPEEIRDLVPHSTFRWVLGQDAPAFERLFVEIDDVPDAVRVSMHLDTDAISLADAETMVRTMEATAIATATAVSTGRAVLAGDVTA